MRQATLMYKIIASTVDYSHNREDCSDTMHLAKNDAATCAFDGRISVRSWGDSRSEVGHVRFCIMGNHMAITCATIMAITCSCDCLLWAFPLCRPPSAYIGISSSIQHLFSFFSSFRADMGIANTIQHPSLFSSFLACPGTAKLPSRTVLHASVYALMSIWQSGTGANPDKLYNII